MKKDFEPAQSTGKLKVLVLDEFQYMRKLVSSMLDQPGGNSITMTAETPDQALEDLNRFEAEIIVTDWNMDFVRRVRDAKKSSNPYVPIIMLTGRTELSEIREARDAGVNEFLAKPVSAKALKSRIEAVMAHPRPFVRTKAYFGSDRRRQKLGPPDKKAGERRKEI